MNLSLVISWFSSSALLSASSCHSILLYCGYGLCRHCGNKHHPHPLDAVNQPAHRVRFELVRSSGDTR